MGMTHDSLLLVDFRQNYDKEAIKKLKLPKIRTVLSFKGRPVRFHQLTEESLALSNQFGDLTHLSKIIIRGHCCKGSNKITSDQYEKLYPDFSNKKDQYQNNLNQVSQSEQLLANFEAYIKGLDAEIAQLQAQEARQITKRTSAPLPSHQSLELEAITEKRAIIVNAMLAVRQEIAALGTDTPNLESVFKAARAELDKQLLTTEQLARFLSANLDHSKINPKVSPEPSGLTKVGSANPPKQRLTRRLTIQAAACEAAAGNLNPLNNSTSPSFLAALYQELSKLGIEANIVGYSISTSFLRNATINQIISIGPIGATTITESNKVHSVGMGYDKTMPDVKYVFNKEFPDGTLYNQWKGTQLSAADSPMADILTEIKAEVWADEWNRKGVGFFGKKLPEGIAQIRNLLPQSWEPTTERDMKSLWRSIETVVSSRLGKNKRLRSDVTANYYASLAQILKYY